MHHRFQYQYLYQTSFHREPLWGVWINKNHSVRGLASMVGAEFTRNGVIWTSQLSYVPCGGAHCRAGATPPSWAKLCSADYIIFYEVAEELTISQPQHTNIQFFNHFIDGDRPVPVYEPLDIRDCVRGRRSVSPAGARCVGQAGSSTLELFVPLVHLPKRHTSVFTMLQHPAMNIREFLAICTQKSDYRTLLLPGAC